MTQASLFAPKAQTAAEDAATLARVLSRNPGWRPRGWLAFCHDCYEWPERRFRAAAAASKGQIIGGQKGYALTREVSDDDADHVERALRSQARQMIRRSIEIRRARNTAALHPAETDGNTTR